MINYLNAAVKGETNNFLNVNPHSILMLKVFDEHNLQSIFLM